MMYVGMVSFYPILATAVSLSAFAGPAGAAEVSTGRTCYADPSARKDTVAWSGSGFTPGGIFQAALDGAALDGGSGTVDGDGRVRGSFAAPSLDAVVAPGTLQHTFRLSVFEGASAPVARFTVSKLRARLQPASGNPRTLRVRFVLHGFGLGRVVRAPIYVHYVRPDGRVRTTARLGTGSGACGSLTTSRRRLFPFAPARGTWTLQFDTAARYVRGTPRAPFLYYRVPVRIT